MVRGFALTIGLLAALPAFAGEMSADEARRFVIGKMFNYTCFEGTRGQGRVNADGSITGSHSGPGCWSRALRAVAGQYAPGER